MERRYATGRERDALAIIADAAAHLFGIAGKSHRGLLLVESTSDHENSEETNKQFHGEEDFGTHWFKSVCR